MSDGLDKCDIYKNDYDIINSINKNIIYKKIIVFDFDGTLTRFNVPTELFKIKRALNLDVIDESLKYLIKNNGISNIFSEFVVDSSFLKLIQDMKSKNIRIMIMSYGYKDIIKKLLKAKGYSNLFELIITPADFNLKEGYDQTKNLDGKNIMLNRVRKVYGVNRDNILLVDDSYENIKRACNKGYKVLHVDSGNGLTKDMVQSITSFAK